MAKELRTSGVFNLGSLGGNASGAPVYSGTWGATDSAFTLTTSPYHLTARNPGGWQARKFDYTLSSGKYYAEIYIDPGHSNMYVGLVSSGFSNGAGWVGDSTDGMGLSSQGGAVYSQGTGADTVTGISFNSGSNVVQIAVDVDNRKAWWGVNGTWHSSSNPSTNTDGISLRNDLTSGDLYFAISSINNTSDFHFNDGGNGTFNGELTANGNTDANGKGDFYYTVPTGFEGLYATGLTADKPTRKWGGLVGRSLIASDALANTGALSLSELLQVQYSVPALSVDTWWTWETPLNSQWSRDGDYECSRTGNYGGHGICVDTEVTSGKYYAEFWWDILKAGSDQKDKGFGLATNTSSGMDDTLGTHTTHVWIHYASNGKHYPANSAWGSTMSNGDVVGVAVDYDNGKVWTHVNGTWSSTGGDPSSSGAGHTWTTHLTAHPSTPARIAFGSNGTSGSVEINGGDNGTFGGNVTAGGNTDTNGLGDFKYTVPTGFQGLYTLA